MHLCIATALRLVSTSTSRSLTSCFSSCCCLHHVRAQVLATYILFLPQLIALQAGSPLLCTGAWAGHLIWQLRRSLLTQLKHASLKGSHVRLEVGILLCHLLALLQHRLHACTVVMSLLGASDSNLSRASQSVSKQ